MQNGPKSDRSVDLVGGFRLGNNILRARKKSASGIRDQSVQFTTFPITGPIFALRTERLEAGEPCGLGVQAFKEE